MKTKKQMKEWILANCVDDDGDIDIGYIDFSDFEGEILRGGWKVKGVLWQDDNIVEGDLHQSRNEVKGNLFQGSNKVKGKLNQDCNEVNGDLCQSNNEVKGKLLQGHNKVKGKLYQNWNKAKGDLHQDFNEVEGSLHQEQSRVRGETYTDFNYHHRVMKLDKEKGWVKDDSVVRQLKDMTKEELIEKIIEMEKQNENK